jgi:predicted nuclease of predicted toxin-antitoxin system
MKILLDMNLSPRWVESLQAEGWEALHWSQVGDPRASDDVIAGWARQHGFVIFTHDLDFGTLLALTRTKGPSVIQVRTQDIFSRSAGTYSSSRPKTL